MTLANQALYQALLKVGAEAALVEHNQEALSRARRKLDRAKDAVRQVVSELPREQLETLLAMPIEDGTFSFWIAREDGEIAIDVRRFQASHRPLHALKPRQGEDG
ncbi:hypothetical protein [Halomonas sp. HG01]|uniref:hypothetical protein n=1 Tax=Halomonas sp. HG01 TaxID=1609967 RepID=UPI0006147A96|nr:hypothetical protein [Halomonas sp. HG01]